MSPWYKLLTSAWVSAWYKVLISAWDYECRLLLQKMLVIYLLTESLVDKSARQLIERVN
jgi:hypothetical protein